MGNASSIQSCLPSEDMSQLCDASGLTSDEIEVSFKYFGEHWRNEGLLSGKQVDVGKSLRETMVSLDSFTADPNVYTNSLLMVLLPAFCIDKKLSSVELCRLLGTTRPDTGGKTIDAKASALFKAIASKDGQVTEKELARFYKRMLNGSYTDQELVQNAKTQIRRFSRNIEPYTLNNQQFVAFCSTETNKPAFLLQMTMNINLDR